MFARTLPASLLLLAVATLAAADGPNDNIPENVRPVPPKGAAVAEADLKELRAGLTELKAAIDWLAHDLLKHPNLVELIPDVEIYHRAVRCAVEFNELYADKNRNDVAVAKKLLAQGLQRANELKEGKPSWATATGYVVRGYRSRIDGSVQPYGLLVPSGYDFRGEAKHRLDLWWHGRGELLTEVNFIGSQQSASGVIPAPGAFVLYPYGRYCNANKFAGEIDTLECLEHARKYYRLDENRLVARGFSMGGAACWQFAVHYPTLWCAAAPGAGFAETPEFLNVFQSEKVEPTWYEKKLWHLYNATDYALNLFNLPTVAYSGENDRQKQAADVMAREMKKVGLDLKHVIGPKAGHNYEKGAKAEVNNLIDAIVEKGRPAEPRPEIKFVTYTLRYNRCGWVTVEGLEKHWHRATLTATKEGRNFDVKTSGVSAFTLNVPPGAMAVSIDGAEAFRLGNGGKLGTTPYAVRFRKEGAKWVRVSHNLSPTEQADLGHVKKPGLQGPIDDAFMSRFVFVKPTGQPMNEAVGKWVEAEMRHAGEHWRRQFRGDVVVKTAEQLTPEDFQTANLILWGDPRSNPEIRKVADRLPVKWTDKGVQVSDQTYPVGTHVPVLIYPNPLNPAKYVVINSGFTFREYDYLNNARQVPKLPDYAVIDVTTPPNSRYPGKIVRAGFFGEKWELQPDDGR
jgi:pimeloyl-ACP methyl ester carboxylesterase